MSPEGLVELGLSSATLDSVSLSMALIDVAIVGGGPAAANTIARQFHTTVAFDNKRYRKAHASHMNFATLPEGISCETVQFVDVGVAAIEKKNDSHFTLIDMNGNEWNFRKVLLAVRSVEKFPDIAGFDGLSGRRETR
ncbi:hypothetical protein C8R45DRAFT_1155821 [Mycena sanguinolenta]|nr:hypothetical protein C8R45DRAFT_1155821 [Mycena sanguinolenta]